MRLALMDKDELLKALDEIDHAEAVVASLSSKTWMDDDHHAESLVSEYRKTRDFIHKRIGELTVLELKNGTNK